MLYVSLKFKEMSCSLQLANSAAVEIMFLLLFSFMQKCTIKHLIC